MTERSKEYIITEDMICFAEGVTGYKHTAFRSRPISLASEGAMLEPDPCMTCPIRLKGSHQCDGNPCGVKSDHARKEHDAAIAQAAREKLLLKYQNWIAKEAKGIFEPETKAFIVRLNKKLVDEINLIRLPKQEQP